MKYGEVLEHFYDHSELIGGQEQKGEEGDFLAASEFEHSSH